jgi:NAD(P)H-dependent flavin oxidoreductase YrpB (nitropropane dioxygenase family)
VRPIPPVLQAPIGGATSPELIRAVTEAGGLSVLPASWTAPDDLRAMLADLQRTVADPVAVNLVLAFPQEERLEICLEAAVPVVSFSWGIRPDLIRRAQAGGVRVLVQVGSAAEARQAVEAGADVIIAQGVEAGGHVQGTTALLALLHAIRRTVDVPVIAAGGIVDEATAATARAAGASAVMAGTRYVASEESSAHPRWKELLVAAGPDETALTGVFDVGWPEAPHRVLRNATFRAWEAAGSPPPGTRPGEGEVLAERGGERIVRYSDTPPSTATTGDVDALCLYAGQGVELIDAVLPAGEITERLLRSFES